MMISTNKKNAVPVSAATHQRSAHLMNQTSFLIQKILFPEKNQVENLYLRFVDGHSKVSEETITMEQGDKISFNTYFNSIYESYWNEITEIDKPFIEVSFTGSITVELYRDTKYSGCFLIASRRFDAKSKEIGKLPFDGFKQPFSVAGRLFVDIFAHSKSEVFAVNVKTSSNMVKTPRLSLGICTYNRELYLLHNLRSLLDHYANDDRLVKIIVVNQGTTFTTPELVNLVNNSEKLLVVEQGNLGGCGGFNRTMYEALELKGVTHHLLMDDDAVLDARILQNLFALLSFTNKNVAIGGHMLDLLRPHYLYEAGARVRSNTRIRTLHHNIDLRAIDAFVHFAKFHSVDYNAWWFCVIPLEEIRNVEFSPPIFIRGDDMEYGIRLQEQGIKTIAMPGIAVWHEPFYVKVGSWQTYYDLRNRLILASTYPHRFRLEKPIDLLWWMLKAAVTHDYLSHQLLVHAIRDFLRGPDVLERGADVVHQEISALTKSYSPSTVSEDEMPPRLTKLRNMPKSNFGLGLLVVFRIFHILLFAKRDGAVTLLDNESNPSNVGAGPYVKTNGIESYRLLYQPDRAKLIMALKQTTKVWFQYVRGRHSIAQQWQQEIPRLRSRDSWQKIFARFED